jgi:hypothetical protein
LYPVSSADHSKQKEIGLAGVTWFVAHLDGKYENGIWQSWPPAPAHVRIMMRYVFWWTNADARKFGAVDRMGNMKPLYAVPQAA